MSNNAAPKSGKFGMIVVIVVGVAVNLGAFLLIYHRTDQEKPKKTPAAGGNEEYVETDSAAEISVKAAPPKMAPDHNEDGVYRNEKNLNIYSGHGIMVVTLPFDGTPAKISFRYRELDVPPLDRIDKQLMVYNNATLETMRQVGVTKEDMARFTKQRGNPEMYPMPTMKTLAALTTDYEKAEGDAKKPALDALTKALAEAGNVYAASYASNFAARKSVMTADQYKSFHEAIQKAYDDEEAKKNAERLERERIAREKQEADRLAAATRKAATPPANIGAAAPAEPKPWVNPYPPAPWDIVDAVHLP